MQLTDEQKKEVAAWIANGAKLSDVQQRLAEEFGVRLTYMEARFLVDDLKLVLPEKPEPEKPAQPADGEPAADELEGLEEEAPEDFPPDGRPAGKVRVDLDQIVRPGALVSGKVTFSDGVAADWYLDQMGRFGLVPPNPEYRPSAEDLSEFRIVLERELARKGL